MTTQTPLQHAPVLIRCIQWRFAIDPYQPGSYQWRQHCDQWLSLKPTRTACTAWIYHGRTGPRIIYQPMSGIIGAARGRASPCATTSG